MSMIRYIVREVYLEWAESILNFSFVISCVLFARIWLKLVCNNIN